MARDLMTPCRAVPCRAVPRRSGLSSLTVLLLAAVILVSCVSMLTLGLTDAMSEGALDLSVHWEAYYSSCVASDTGDGRDLMGDGPL
jgi:hypothetical protein